MREHDHRAIEQELRRRFAGELPNDLVDELDRTLEILPDGDWSVAENKPPVVFLLADAGPLFTVTLNPETGKIALSSQPLDGEKIIVGLEWGKRSGFGIPRPGARRVGPSGSRISTRTPWSGGSA